MEKPKPPEHEVPSPDWEHLELRARVIEAVEALPAYFKPETYIAGINAPDLHTLNTVLGATIEDQTVATLNAMRPIWDPDKQYALYYFVRQAQTFPDVLLRRAPSSAPATGATTDDIIMGIELKGWYVLAKEGVPTFRFAVTPSVCAVADLLVVVPWALSYVISGKPLAFAPYIKSARWAAEARNHWWQYQRDAKTTPDIVHPYGAPNLKPYPRKADKIDDKPASDGGGNFGRFARTHLMDGYIAETKRILLCGLPIEKWLLFFKSIDDTFCSSSGAREFASRRAFGTTRVQSQRSRIGVAMATTVRHGRLLCQSAAAGNPKPTTTRLPHAIG